MSGKSQSVKNNRDIAKLPLLPSNSTAKSKEYPVDGVPCLMVSVNKRTKTFTYRPTLADGTKPRIPLGPFPAVKLEEAKDQAWEILRRVRNGEDPREERRAARGMPTFKEFALETYLPYSRQHKADFKGDISKLNCHMLPVFGPRRMCDITRKDIDQYLSCLLSEEKGLEISTRNRHLALLKAMFRKAVEYEVITHNPAALIKMLKENNARDRHLEGGEIGRFIAACEAEPNRILGRYFLFQLFTGLRKCEGLDAKWEHVDFEAKKLFLPHTKSGKSRHVDLSIPALGLLQELQTEAVNDFVFPGRCKNKPYNNTYKALKRVLAAANIADDFHLHDLRHTFASLAANNGVEIAELQKLLGHASLQTTMRYIHWYNARLQRATNQVADAIQRALQTATPGPVDKSSAGHDDEDDAMQDQAA